MCRSLSDRTRVQSRDAELQTVCRLMLSTCTFTPWSRVSLERARNRKANQLVRGNMSSIAKGVVFWRALTILIDQSPYPNRFKPGTNKAANHQTDMEAARSMGTICSSGNQTRIPALVPVFLHISKQQ